jgi:Tfp pilus assembly protein FimT
MAGHAALRRIRGISLAEFLVVAAILTTLLAIAVPTTQSSDVAGAEARRVLADAQRARSAARARWESVLIEFEVGGGRWRVRTQAGVPVEGAGSDPAGWRSLDPQVRFEAISSKESSFVFLPNGRTERAAAIRLVAGDRAWEVGANSLGGQLYSEPVP